jgi:4-nitrophenyl phosphatase
VIGAIEIASGKKATIIGKPQPLLYQMALRRLALAPEETLGIGDRLETDIAGAQAAGMPSALVLTGAATLAQAKAFSPPPDIIIEDLSELIF